MVYFRELASMVHMILTTMNKYQETEADTSQVEWNQLALSVHRLCFLFSLAIMSTQAISCFHSHHVFTPNSFNLHAYNLWKI
jgi:hypothetical protein